MPQFDAAATALIDNAQVIRPAYFAYLDVAGDPVRVTTFGASVTFQQTGDPDLDGHTFHAIDPNVVEIGDVSNQEGGSDTLACRLSGLLSLDSDLLNTIGNRANWQGRPARLWMRVHDENDAQVGAIVPYYTGYMMGLEILPSPSSQVIELQIENYLAMLTQASNRTYLGQAEYDPGDLSAQATIGAANNAKAGPGGAGVGRGDSNPNIRRAFQERLGG